MSSLYRIWRNKQTALKKKVLIWAGGILIGIGMLLIIGAKMGTLRNDVQKDWQNQLQQTLSQIQPTPQDEERWEKCGTAELDWERCFSNLPLGEKHLVWSQEELNWVYWTDTSWPVFQLDSIEKNVNSWSLLSTGNGYWLVYSIKVDSYIHLRAWSTDKLFSQAIQILPDSSATHIEVLTESQFSSIEVQPDTHQVQRFQIGGKTCVYLGFLAWIFLLLHSAGRKWQKITLAYILAPLALLIIGLLEENWTEKWLLLLQGQREAWEALDWVYTVAVLSLIVTQTPHIIKGLGAGIRNQLGKWGQATIYFISLILAYYLAIFIIRYTVFYQLSIVRAEDLLHWNSSNLFWYIGIVSFVSTLFVMSYRIHKSVLQLGLTLDKKLLSLLMAGVVFLPFYLLFPIQVHPFAFFILSFIIIILMDLFAENVSGGLTWPFIWLTVLAACTSLLVFRFSTLAVKKEQAEAMKTWMTSKSEVSDTKDIFSWAKYKNDRIVYQNGPIWRKPSSLDFSIPDGAIIPYETDQAYYFLGKQNDTTYVIARPKTGINEPISLYALFFVLWVAVALILLLINRPLKLLPSDWAFYWTELPSLRKRIQFYILAVTVGSFGVMACVTYFYFEYQGGEQSKQLALQVTTAAVRDFTTSWEEQPETSLKELFNEIQKKHQTSGSLYTFEGIRISGVGLPLLPHSISKPSFFSSRDMHIQEGSIYHRINGPANGEAIAQFDAEVETLQLGLGFRQIILTLLNIYVFLFVLTGGIAVAVSNSITAPLKVLSERLKSLKLGKKNVPLNWNQKDELGELIRDYNRMILQLEESAKIMATTERETAWREMAKQVAHEIKNPLTPMKLSLQHLQFAIENDNPNKEKLFRKVSATLIEQIDNLNRIASEFSSFAKMPEPENRVVSLNEVVASIHDLFRERKDMDIKLFVPIDDLRVFADKDHLLRVMSNLIKNAIQAIPSDRRGLITIKLYKKADEAVIKVSDNGKGIPDEVKEKVFKPNFTSKSSGTGLGLAICANIIEGFNGKIYFETEVNKGTDFYVIIPLMRTKENFNQRQRVPLE